MDLLSLIEWPAMLVTLAAAWLVASRRPQRRHIGFWLFLLSNGLWAVWGWHTGAQALIALQVGLAVFNLRGAFKTLRAPGCAPRPGRARDLPRQQASGPS